MAEQLKDLQCQKATSVAQLHDAVQNIYQFRSTLERCSEGKQREQVKQFLKIIFGNRGEPTEQDRMETDTESIQQIRNNQFIQILNRIKLAGETTVANEADDHTMAPQEKEGDQEEQEVNTERPLDLVSGVGEFEEPPTGGSERANSPALFENNDSWDTSTVKAQANEDQEGTQLKTPR